MSDLRDLYQELILDHNKSPRNFRKIEPADRQADGHNPLCGDNITIYIKVTDSCIDDIAFVGSGCAISKASASLMTEALKGKSLAEVESLFQNFHSMVTGDDENSDPSTLGKLKVMAGVSEFPVRVKCATLAWHTVQAAIEQKDDPVTTE